MKAHFDCVVFKEKLVHVSFTTLRQIIKAGLPGLLRRSQFKTGRAIHKVGLLPQNFGYFF